VTPVGAASFLKVSSKRVSLDLRPGSPGETLDPSRDRARAALLCRFASWGLALDVRWSEGFVECFGGFGGGGFVFGQAGRGLGAGVVVGAVAPVFRLRLLR
jgi:hypothetical protein